MYFELTFSCIYCRTQTHMGGKKSTNKFRHIPVRSRKMLICMLASRLWLNLNQPPYESMSDSNRPGDRNMLQFKMNDKFEGETEIYLPNLQIIHINI